MGSRWGLAAWREPRAASYSSRQSANGRPTQMARYAETTSALGARIMNYRKERDLTQSDLAVRFNVSGPAIFKFEKGFVTPSLQLWLKIATGMGIPEKEAVLVWVREKLPENMRKMVDETTVLDVNGLRDT